jgi:hypothetical protein
MDDVQRGIEQIGAAFQGKSQMIIDLARELNIELIHLPVPKEIFKRASSLDDGWFTVKFIDWQGDLRGELKHAR